MITIEFPDKINITWNTTKIIKAINYTTFILLKKKCNKRCVNIKRFLSFILCAKMLEIRTCFLYIVHFIKVQLQEETLKSTVAFDKLYIRFAQKDTVTPT